ncbi:MAG: hypothetical protein J7K15_13115 [Deltaproteobacteria bacterium]|nr:hypothetical protein [Deltaproteobacteria bacterium]
MKRKIHRDLLKGRSTYTLFPPLASLSDNKSLVTDGIIVGSAIIKLIEAYTIKKGNDLKAGPGLVKKVGEFISSSWALMPIKEYCSGMKPLFRKPCLTGT